jgi:hypothetical protein
VQPLGDEEANTLANLFAKNFIARSDVKAIQLENGGYNPVESPFSRADLLSHLGRQNTYGHYMLNKADECKIMVFDIDLDKADPTKNIWYQVPTEHPDNLEFTEFAPGSPRDIWQDRSATVARTYFKIMLRSIGEKLAAGISRELQIPVAAAYTGSKGIHVYGFTDRCKASDVQEGAKLVLNALGCFEPWRGNAFYRHVRTSDAAGNYSPELSYEGLTVEVFPKQTSLEGKTFGNLVRLPLGVNRKNPHDPTFFLDFRTAIGDGLIPRPAVDALTAHNYWA